jgi:hypothetical protein
MWRTAFATLTSREHLDAFVAGDGHLPRFLHLDLRSPDQPCGKPYWERFDVTPAQWQSQAMPTSTFRSGPAWVLVGGAAMATEARIRTFGIWKPGQSSSEDMVGGASAYIFTRQNQEGRDGVTVFFSPRVLARTTTYAFECDHFGRVADRSDDARFDFDAMTGFADGGNEALVKDAMSLLDDVEILIFSTVVRRDEAIKRLAALGITEIRGVPVAARFIARRSGQRAVAKAAVRKAFTQ